MARPDAWFRLYNGAVDNPKVQRLPPPLFKVWINLLCVASRHGGRLPPLADVAFILRVKESQARAWLSALERHRLFERDADGAAAPHDWDTLQFKTDTSKLRTREYRERRKAAEDARDDICDNACDVTGDLGVTPPEQSRPEQSKTDSPLSPPEGADAGEEISEGFSEDFLKFWEAYPEKVGQKAAWKAWRRANDRPEAAAILAAVDRYVRTKPSDRAWCNPSTWLRQGRWADAREAPSPPDAPKLCGGRTEAQWRWGAKLYAQKKYWPPSFGPAPGTGGCACPAAVLAAFKLTR